MSCVTANQADTQRLEEMAGQTHLLFSIIPLCIKTVTSCCFAIWLCIITKVTNASLQSKKQRNFLVRGAVRLKFHLLHDTSDKYTRPQQDFKLKWACNCSDLSQTLELRATAARWFTTVTVWPLQTKQQPQQSWLLWWITLMRYNRGKRGFGSRSPSGKLSQLDFKV